MKGLPKDMMPNRDNMVFWDTERKQLYMVRWEDGGNNDIPHRIYIEYEDIKPRRVYDNI